MNKQEIHEKILEAVNQHGNHATLQALEDEIVENLKKVLPTLGLAAWGISPWENDERVEITVYTSFVKPDRADVWNKIKIWADLNGTTESSE